ncbi:DUF5959 family protein [Amycolatopsis lurida]
MAEEPIDLVRLGYDSNSVVVRITGDQGAGALSGEFVVDTPFVRGSLRTPIQPDDLWRWRDALDALDADHEVVWRDGSPGPRLHIEREADEELAHVTVGDNSLGGVVGDTTVSITVPLTDSWFDDAYERLDLILKTWSLTED